MSRPYTVVSVVGARPNFMKTAPVVAELKRRSPAFRSVLIHTGQHYDDAMSRVFLDELGVGAPERQLSVGSGSHAMMTARVMERIEPVLLEERPDLVLVPGDVNSTLAAALVAVKLEIPVAHLEAGLRSFDRSMPEEINRVLTDQVSDVLLVHSPEAFDNLAREGIPASAIHAVGNTMIDTLVRLLPAIRSLKADERHRLRRGEYLLVTLHRPALVDGPLLASALQALCRVAAELDVVFPCHPRTRARIRELGLEEQVGAAVRLMEPLGYLEFLSLLDTSAAVLTDSGGVQEETTYLGVPCFTLRSSTERPVTCTLGTNVLLGLDPSRISEIPEVLRSWNPAGRSVPELWDGRAATRVVDVLAARGPAG